MWWRWQWQWVEWHWATCSAPATSRHTAACVLAIADWSLDLSGHVYLTLRNNTIILSRDLIPSSYRSSSFLLKCDIHTVHTTTQHCSRKLGTIRISLSIDYQLIDSNIVRPFLSFFFPCGAAYAYFVCQRWGLPHGLAQCTTPRMGLV